MSGRIGSMSRQCNICGARLQRLDGPAEAHCDYCGKSQALCERCLADHFICDDCSAVEVMSMIEGVVMKSGEKDPVVLSELLMRLPALPMLGCEHAFIAAGSLAAALKNSRYAKITNREVREILTRTADHSREESCSRTGLCSVASAVGACFSVFLDARFGSDSEQKIVTDAAIRVSQAIAGLTGPVCCKAFVRTAVDTGVSVLAERFGIVLPVSRTPLVCNHSSRHPHGCREDKCPYYRRESKDIFADSIHLPVTVCHS